MFHCFFPRPKLFFSSFALFSLLCVIVWFTLGESLAHYLSFGGVFGYGFPADFAVDADDAAKAAHAAATQSAVNFFFYEYIAVCISAFCIFWMTYAPHKWSRWSVLGSVLIVFVIWFQVQVDVMINAWFGTFYDLVQKALSAPNSIQPADFWWGIWTFFSIASIAVTVAVINLFFVSHYVFRWRTAMTEYYTEHWPRLRHIEGASQRVQEDTMRFASTVEGLGTRIIDTVMTLIAFLPILWVLSKHVTELPLIGEVPDSLVFVAIVWAAVGTALLAVAGMKLPGLEFRNQRVEAAYRKELVLGEDHKERAQPPTLHGLFDNVRHNYFRLYFNYLYFNVVRYAYLQTDAIFAYVILGPTIISGTITLGVLQQISRAFGRVTNSFQFLVNSWTTIVELISIYKRLKAFEAAMLDKPLDDIEAEAGGSLIPAQAE
ncbi:Peptide antibiotic transporter SbmA [Hartmannibacter diazotrophicus]|uniref:Peptide antibiotic transporter SbmA n=1 Tax=Hartmannibacter diazotrophicus TaxID=1482074 RepID=A0A2C9D092_9HYPH|nr:peptide antibiotic transporter SbmA [Hartmannibacter diazotrophicus]SON53680.1 Peptide antibiotic transporter SbmA [Hartmannibacter diazotrophicus]